jgi:ABC-2 type transport system permease protein
MLRRILALARKELRQVRRDRRTLSVLLLIPAAWLVLFGYALNFDVKHLPLGVLDHDRTPQSRDLAARFGRTEYFDLVRSLERPGEADAALAREELAAVLAIPPGFGAALAAGREARVQVLLDGSNSMIAGAAAGYAAAIARQASALASLEAVGGAAPPPPLDFRPRVRYNPELMSAKFLIPGLMGLILTITAVVSIALSIVRERERNTMEQLAISPVTDLELILGKTLPYLAVSLGAAALILLAGRALFGVSVAGSWLLLFAATALFLAACLGMGMVISTLVDTQQAAFTLALLAALLPSFLLSGFVFPIGNMPVLIQWISRLVPARYYLVALRGIILKGAGPSAFAGQLAWLALFAAATLGLAAVRMAGRRRAGR